MIKMTASMSGVDFALAPGDVTDRFPAEEEDRLVKAGFAVPHVEPRTEKATKKPAPETRG